MAEIDREVDGLGLNKAERIRRAKEKAELEAAHPPPLNLGFPFQALPFPAIFLGAVRSDQI